MAIDLDRTKKQGNARQLAPLFFVGALLAGWLLPTLTIWVGPLVAVAALLSGHRRRWLIVALATAASLVAAFMLAEGLFLTAELAS